MKIKMLLDKFKNKFFYGISGLFLGVILFLAGMLGIIVPFILIYIFWGVLLNPSQVFQKELFTYICYMGYLTFLIITIHKLENKKKTILKNYKKK